MDRRRLAGAVNGVAIRGMRSFVLNDVQGGGGSGGYNFNCDKIAR